MRKFHITFILLSIFRSLQAQVPVIFVGGENVIETGTYVYVKATEFTVKKDTSRPSRIVLKIKGNLELDGDYVNATDGRNVVLTRTGADDYGQLIIQESKPARGKLEIEPDFKDAAYINLSIPFDGYTFADLAKDLKIKADYTTRYKCTFLIWDQENVEADHITEPSRVIPAFTPIAVKKSAGMTAGIYSAGLRGRPENKVGKIALTPFNILPAGKNSHGERYWTYLDDFFVKYTNVLTDKDWGHNVFELTNPYTSNIDLSYIGFNESGKKYVNDNNAIKGLKGVSIDASNTYDEETGTRYSGHVIAKTDLKTGQFVTGETLALVIQPGRTFAIKTDGRAGQVFNFGDALKTFSMKSKSSDDSAGSDKASRSSRSESSLRSNDRTTYQVALRLIEADGSYNGKRVYLAANNYVQPGDELNNVENYYPNFESGFYSTQENADGTINETRKDEKLLINVVNINDYRNKPISLTFVPENGKSTYKIESELRQQGVRVSSGNFSNPKAKFIFEDKKSGVIIEIDADFSYEFTQATKTSTRFVVYLVGEKEIRKIVKKKKKKKKKVLDPNENTEDTIRLSRAYEHEGAINVNLVSEELGKRVNIRIYDTAGKLIRERLDISTTGGIVVLLVPVSGIYVVTLEGVNGKAVSNKVIIK